MTSPDADPNARPPSDRSRQYLTLGRSFLWQVVLPRACVLVLWSMLNEVVTLPLRVLYGLILIDLLLMIWQIRQFLRSADQHILGTGHMVPVWGGYLAILFAGFATVTLWWDAVLIATAPDEISAAEQMRLEREARYQLEVSQDGTELRLAGEIQHGLTKRVAALIAENSALERITLCSEGGLIYEARGVARLVADHQLDTLAEGSCASACTLIFAAGVERDLAPGAVLGFHSYQLAYGGGLPQVDVAAEQARDRRFLTGRGISAAFIDQIYATPASALWTPSRSDLRIAGVLTPAG
ncbi:hypothetical protein [Phaeobacter sp.]|uniref:COG3904 family protein n=1 Tax=Phaeobacter sp. TaxID=1902409 RepID=UPI0025E2B802|nr:hypothetical protein [Phaeobacter sp.]